MAPLPPTVRCQVSAADLQKLVEEIRAAAEELRKAAEDLREALARSQRDR